MILLRRYIKGDNWTKRWVWVKHDHISFLTEGFFVPRGQDRETYTTITTIGGGTTDVHESPYDIIEKMPERWQEM
jgi:hypothetical protein